MKKGVLNTIAHASHLVHRQMSGLPVCRRSFGFCGLPLRLLCEYKRHLEHWKALTGPGQLHVRRPGVLACGFELSSGFTGFLVVDNCIS